MLSVEDIMTREPYTLGPDDTLRDAAALMRAHHIRHIPIVGADRSVIGIVSHRDVLAASDWSLGDGPRDDGDRGGDVALSALMSTPAHTVPESADLLAVAIHLRRQRMGCLPVTHEGRLTGIISDSDFLEIAITLLERMEMTEPEAEI